MGYFKEKIQNLIKKKKEEETRNLSLIHFILFSLFILSCENSKQKFYLFPFFYIYLFSQGDLIVKG
jgi:hypothetical protein